MLYSFSTIYSWAWDVLYDWKMVTLTSPCTLRSRRMFSSKPVYIAAIALNLAAKFFWVTTMMPDSTSEQHVPASWVFYSLAVHMAPVVEVFRRAVWSIFRLENEHLSNTGGYRTSQHIPLHFKSSKPPTRTTTENDASKTRRIITLEITAFILSVGLVILVSIVFRATHEESPG